MRIRFGIYLVLEHLRGGKGGDGGLGHLDGLACSGVAGRAG